MGTNAEQAAAEQKLNEQLAPHIGQFGKVAHIEIDGKLYVFRPPTLDEYEEFQERARNPAVKRGAAYREIAQMLLVTPSLDMLQAAFKAYPALAPMLSDSIAELAGATLEVSVKKG